MNHAVEKWLTVAAFAGWLTSIASLVGLSLQVTPSALASRSVHAAHLYTVERSKTQSRPASTEKGATQQQLANIEVPSDASEGYWVKSLKVRSSDSESWVSPRH